MKDLTHEESEHYNFKHKFLISRSIIRQDWEREREKA